MSDFLSAVRSVRRQDDKPAESLLTEVKTTEWKAGKKANTIRRSDQPEVSSHDHIDVSRGQRTNAETPEEALQTLRSAPDTDVLTATLRQLSRTDAFEGSFSLHAPGPLQAQIIHILLSAVVPNFWSVLGAKEKTSLVSCLTNVAGTSAVVARLRLLSAQGKAGKSESYASVIAQTLDVASQVFRGERHVSSIWTALQLRVTDKIKRELAWKEYVVLVGSGRVISSVAEAEEVLKSAVSSVTACWLSNGTEYVTWLGKNLACLWTEDVVTTPIHSQQTALPATGGRGAGAQLLVKTLRLGYPIPLVKALYTELVGHSTRYSDGGAVIQAMAACLPAYARYQLLEHTLRWLSSIPPSDDSSRGQSASVPDADVSAAAALLNSIQKESSSIQQHLLKLLADPVLTTSLSFLVRRACLVTLSSCVPDELRTLMERTMTIFNDPLLIKHAPVLQQESLAQTLLLAAGYIHRRTPVAVRTAARSGGHMQGVSNRLEASNPGTRWLGMVVGTALSGLVDLEGSQMSFGTEDMQTDEAKWYFELVNVEDTEGTLQDFQTLLESQERVVQRTKPARPPKTQTMSLLNGKPVFGPVPPPKPSQTEVEGSKVAELLEEDFDEDEDDLKPYAKPDSDPEDSDEDATLVNRHKPRPPVYIRDLMAMLRDGEKPDRFQLGVKHAASLIRRKTSFGREVTDHAEELASILCGLQDPFETEDLEELQLQALIAVLLSDVAVMAPWLSRQAFTGDFSLAQRCIMLTTLGLGGRELAGFKDEDELNPKLSNSDFLSKRLPTHLHTIYSPVDPSLKRLESASKSLEHQLIHPLALQAADRSTAHLNAFKVRTFSSRMSVERTKRKPAANSLAKIFAQAFFFPLTNRYQQDIAAYSSSSLYASAPFLLVTFLKTLALLLHASGPATLNLPQITSEFWDLLLSLRVQAIGDISVLEAVLFALLTLLEVNSDKRRIADEHAKQLMETQQWVELVFERTGGGELVTEGNGEEVKVRALAAGVLVRCGEVIEMYQKEVMGGMVNY